MNRRFILIVFAAVLGNGNSFGQSVLNQSPLNIPGAFLQKGTSTGKTTASASRLIQEVRFQSDGTSFIPIDSTVIDYSGSHGGDLTHTIKFDVGYIFNYSNTSPAGYSNYEKVLNAFDLNDNISNKLVQYWVPFSGTYRSFQQSTFTYDVMNNLLTGIIQTWDTVTNTWINTNKYSRTYDGKNNVTRSVTQTWTIGTSSWTDVNDESYTYVNTGKVATIITRIWNTVTSSWDNSTKTLNTYDGSDNLISAIGQYPDSSTNGWANSFQHTYSYDATNNLITDLNQNWTAGSNSWYTASAKTFSNFVGHQPQQEVDQNWNTSSSSFINNSETVSGYNTANQLIYQYNQTWNPSGFWQQTILNTATRYGYETYNTKVQNIANTGGEAIVYPVPAKNMLSISVSWNMPQAFSITIIDLQGRIIRQQEMPASIQYNSTMSIGDLLPGNYILRIDGSDGSIIKQLTVQN